MRVVAPHAMQRGLACKAWAGTSSLSSLARSSRVSTRCSPGAGTSTSHDHFTVTTPLYYVNAAPHMGSAYPTIAADVLARYQKLRGKHVTFITGTDEHGEKIALAADKRGMTPLQHCDDIAAEYKDLWHKMDIGYDRFVRTTDARHEALVCDLLTRVWDKGDIYLKDYEGWYCVGCEEFKDEKEMDAGRCCPTHRTPCSHRKEGNYFFRLSKYQNEVQELLAGNTEFLNPPARRNELIQLVKDGLRDFSISRAAVEWGIPIPQDPKQTVYVWFDALAGYLSGVVPEGASPSIATVSASSQWPASVHIIGKDILRFHAVYWPAMLISAGLPLPGRVFGHGFLTKDNLKMGKSLGNILQPRALVDAYGADAVRFYFMKEIAFGTDGDFSEQRFRDVVNATLANNVGNILNRSLTLLSLYCGGQMPEPASAEPSEQEAGIRSLVAAQLELAAAAYDRLAFSEAIEAVVALSSRGNLLLEETQPWTSLKKGTDEEKRAGAAALATALELLRVTALALSPVTPALSAKVFAQLGYSEAQIQALSWKDTAWGGLKPGHRPASPPTPVFARIDGDYVTEPAPGTSTKAAVKPKVVKKPKEKKHPKPVEVLQDGGAPASL